MLKELSAQKLYYGFPIFVLSYPDEKYGYNITTCSSSYSLRQMIVFGLGKGTNAAKQLIKYQRGAANIMAPGYHELVEYAGNHHGQNKLDGGRVPFDLVGSPAVPVLKQASVAIVFHVDHYEMVGGYVNFTATISTRLAQDNLIAGAVLGEELETMHYTGMDHDLITREIKE